jgi:hypothetical protein
MRAKGRKSSSRAGTINMILRAQDPTDPVEATKRSLASHSEVLRTRQDQTRPNTEPGRGFFFLGSLPHPGVGRSQQAAPGPSASPFLLLRKEIR